MQLHTDRLPWPNACRSRQPSTVRQYECRCSWRGHIDKTGTKQHVEDTLEYTLDVKSAMAKAIVDDPMALQVQVAQDVGQYASHSYRLPRLLSGAGLRMHSMQISQHLSIQARLH